MIIRIGIPNRGRLHELAKTMLENRLRLNWHNNRKMIFKNNIKDIGEIEFVFLRSTDIPRMIEKNIIQFGITGNDYYLESFSDIYETDNIYLLNGSLCILTSIENKAGSIKELLDNKQVSCFSQYDRLSTYFWEQISKSVNCVKIDGAAESYLLMNECDIIIDVVSSGETYIENNLKVVSKIMSISSFFYANKNFAIENRDIFGKIRTSILGYKDTCNIRQIDSKELFRQYIQSIDINDYCEVAK